MQSILSGRRVSRAALVGSTAMLASWMLAGEAAYAQDAAPAAGSTVGEVVVTGSRIARRDFTADSPVVTVTSQAFQNTSQPEVEDTLN